MRVKFLCETSRGKKIDRQFWVIQTVVQNENMLCPRIIDESNLDSPFLKTRTSPIRSRKAFVSLSNATWNRFSNVVADVVSGRVIANKE
jgi:hypothetical protein